MVSLGGDNRKHQDENEKVRAEREVWFSATAQQATPKLLAYKDSYLFYLIILCVD